MYEVKDKQTNKQTVLHWPAYTALMFTDVYCTALYFNVLSLVHNPSVSQFTVMYQLSVSSSVSHSVSQYIYIQFIQISVTDGLTNWMADWRRDGELVHDGKTG